MKRLLLLPLAALCAASPKTAAKEVKVYGELHAGPFYSSRIPTGWKAYFPEDAALSSVQARSGDMDRRIEFQHVFPGQAINEQGLHDSMHARSEQQALFPIKRVRAGRLNGLQGAFVRIVNGKPLAIHETKYLSPRGGFYSIWASCPAGEWKQWSTWFDYAASTFQPR